MSGFFTASDQQCIHSRWWLASNRAAAAAVVTLRSFRWSILTQWHRAWRATDLQLKVFQCNRPRDMHRLTSLFIDAFLQIQSSLLNQIYTIRGICMVDWVIHTYTHIDIYTPVCIGFITTSLEPIFMTLVLFSRVCFCCFKCKCAHTKASHQPKRHLFVWMFQCEQICAQVCPFALHEVWQWTGRAKRKHLKMYFF